MVIYQVSTPVIECAVFTCVRGGGGSVGQQVWLRSQVYMDEVEAR